MSSFRLLARRAATLPARRLFTTTTAAASSRGLQRVKEYYDNTLSEDLMVLTYDHARVAPPFSKHPDIEVQIANALSSTSEEPKPAEPKPVEVRTRKGGKPVKPIQPLKSYKTIPGLDKIVLHAMVKEAIGNKSNLLSAFMAFQSITSQRPEVVYATTSVANWKLR